ncbi:MAG: hypothetical protein R3C99_28435 [Pirellulaceae bacterium]
MPFEPRLIEPDDAPQSADGELLLDDSLRQIAERLRTDASDLAAKYPFGSSARTLETVSEETVSVETVSEETVSDLPSPKTEAERLDPRQPVGLYLVGVAAGLVGLAICISLVFQIGWYVPRAAVRPSSPLVSGDSPRPGEAEDSGAAREFAPTEQPLEVTPVIALPPLSSPELEGYIDLLEDDNAGEPRVAI